MDLVIRATCIYFFLLFILRIAGKRTMAELSTFDFVLLLVVAEATDNSIIAQDHSVTSTVVVITTFVFLEIILSFLKQKSKTIDKWLEGTPIVVVKNGKLIKERADKEKIDEGDVMQQARKLQGIERMDQIKYAIMEKSGGITIIPKA